MAGEFPPILVIEASAGSGKTYRLSLEYIARLISLFKGPNETWLCNRPGSGRLLNRILAITFTNKAAAEMKQRIISRLAAFAKAGSTQDLTAGDSLFLEQLCRMTGVSQEAVVNDFARPMLDLIIRRFSDFSIKTIDSLLLSVVRVLSPDLNLPPDYTIEIDSGPALTERSKDFLSLMANREWDKVEQYLLDHAHTTGLPSWTVEQDAIRLIGLFHHQVLRSSTRWNHEEPSRLRANLLEAFGPLKTAFTALLEVMDKDPDRQYLSRTYARDRFLANLRSIHSWSDVEPVLGPTFFKKDDPRVLLKKATPIEYATVFSEAYGHVRACLRVFVEAFSLFRTAHIQSFFSRFEAFWTRANTTLYVEEFSARLHHTLKNWHNALPYLYLKLSDRVRHVLFDEFQDTSEMQFLALAPLIDEVLCTYRDASLFVVGDRKQAIYRWRGGQARLMDDSGLARYLPNALLRAEAPDRDSLDSNYRSRQEIIAFNNRFWRHDTLANYIVPPYGAAVAEHFKNAAQEWPTNPKRTGGLVEVWLQPRAREPEDLPLTEQLHARIYGFIQRALERGYQPADIAILTRTRIEAEPLIQYLAHKQIDTVSQDALLLSSSWAVNEVIALFRFLNFPPDDLHFHLFVSGRLFTSATGFAAEDMTDLAPADRYARKTPLYRRFRRKHKTLWQKWLRPLFQSAGFLSPYDLVHLLNGTFRVHKLHQDASLFLLAFCQMLQEMETQGISSLSGVLDAWDTLAEAGGMPSVDMPADPNRVRIMTQHKAKGLEFPVVIVPVSGSHGKRGQNLFFSETGIYYIAKDYHLLSPKLARIFERERRQQAIDDLNLLYVACTRARDALFLPVVHPHYKDMASWEPGNVATFILSHPLFSGNTDADGCFRSGNLPEKPAATIAPRARELPLPDSPAAGSGFFGRPLCTCRERATGTEDDNRKRGERIHQLLAELPQNSNLDNQTIRDLSARYGLSPQDGDVLARFFATPEVRPFFSSQKQVFCEKEVVHTTETGWSRRRIDRLLVDKQTVWIVEFKTGGKEDIEQYHRQVSGYAEVMAILYPHRDIRGFLLFIDSAEVEEVPC